MHADELLSDIESAAQRIWTSACKMGAGVDSEFCSILNEAIRTDDAHTRPAAVVARAINLLCVVHQKAHKFLAFPRGGVLWRGGDLPDEHRAFYAEGVQFRVPGFLATSFNEDKADEFLYRAHEASGRPAVKWCVQLDPRGERGHAEHAFKHRCKHVSLIEKQPSLGCRPPVPTHARRLHPRKARSGWVCRQEHTKPRVAVFRVLHQTD